VGSICRIRSTDDFKAIVEHDDLRVAMQSLSEVERRAIQMRYFEEVPQAEIGCALGYSQVHVSRIIGKALKNYGTR
jgi:RNA polymerase sigma-B factor